MSLSEEDLDALAEKVAERLVTRLRQTAEQPRQGLVTARVVADELGLKAEWVYANRELLGGTKLGPGRSAPVRFNLTRVRKLVENGEVAVLPANDSRPRRRRRRKPSTNGLQPGVKMIKPRGAR